MEHDRKGDYGGKEWEKRVLRRERKRFRDRDKGLKVDEDDEWMIFLIFVISSSLTGISSEVGR